MLLRSVLLLAAAAGCLGQTASSAFRKIEDVPGLPRVLLIGDSISIGYTEPVRTELKDKANVHRIPVNAATTAVGLKNLEDWLGSGHWDVIHFNFGLHDLKIMDDGQRQVPLPDYERNLRMIREAAFRRALEIGEGGQSGGEENGRRPRWVETRLAEVATLDCLGSELEDEPLEVHWMRLPAREKITFDHKFEPAGKAPPKSR